MGKFTSILSFLRGFHLNGCWILSIFVFTETSFLLFKYILLIMLIELYELFPLCPSLPSTPIPSSILPLLSSCPWVAHMRSLASPFPILFLTSSCLFCTYQLCFLVPEPFSLFSLFSLSADNPPKDLHIYGSVPVIVVCLGFFLDSVVDSCEFVAFLMFIVLIFPFS